jgi:hypothetical protein
MKLIIKIIFLLANFTCFSQKLHHQMVSSQGGNTTAFSGEIFKYSIGQQSVTGTTKGNVITQQGFQQSNWKKIIATNNTVRVNTTTYPNPFEDIVNFQFSQPVGDQVSILIYDILGRQVYYNMIPVTENKIIANLQELQSAEYFVKLSNNSFTYHTKIIKN